MFARNPQTIEKTRNRLARNHRKPVTMRELEFIGEYDAPATAANELVRAATGFAFDLIAERVSNEL